jgi:hypothetical protein
VHVDTWRQVLPPETVLVGVTAAGMHGIDLGRQHVEVAVPASRGTRSRRGLLVRHLMLPASDVVTVRGVAVTSLYRTLRDLCVLEPAVEALVALDMAIRLRRTNKPALRRYVSGAAGLPGTRRMRRLIELAEPAESQMETRLRWLLVSAGLPQPEVQVDLHDDEGDFVGRADLYYRASRLVIEYDGGNHRERLVSDDRRQNLLIAAGYRILRFTAADIHGRPEIVVAQVRGSI